MFSEKHMQKAREMAIAMIDRCDGLGTREIEADVIAIIATALHSAQMEERERIAAHLDERASKIEAVGDNVTARTIARIYRDEAAAIRTTKAD